MDLNQQQFHTIMLDLIEENPIACQAIFSISRTEFTDSVSTLAVTLEDRPVLKVNLGFIIKHAETEEHVKALLLHEFLHVLLNHTENFKTMDHCLNLALDAIINHIIHRDCGDDYSSFFRKYYKRAKGTLQYLKPLSPTERARGWSDSFKYEDSEQLSIRISLIKGNLVVDDMIELAGTCCRQNRGRRPSHSSPKSNSQEKPQPRLPRGRFFLGNHDPQDSENNPVNLSEKVREALENTLKSMNGSGIFRSPGTRGVGGNAYKALFEAKSERLILWEKTAYGILMDFLTPDHKSQRNDIISENIHLPVLNSSDRRGFLKSLWNPIIPEINWNIDRRISQGSCVIYLDVSGSMNAEMQALIGLLNRLRKFIKSPFWAFSNEVKPAVIENSILKTETSGGTSMNCVLHHIADTLPGKAVVITDGYIEKCKPSLLKKLKDHRQDVFAIISRDGNSGMLDKAGIPNRQLDPYPEERA
ncbi:MAG TPA: hypothetical protein EYQ50_22415 [Verrucomicrobiales bacterium]|nr:hypothetical protein [Verrucomicrobiales bacterium]